MQGAANGNKQSAVMRRAARHHPDLAVNVLVTSLGDFLPRQILLDRNERNCGHFLNYTNEPPETKPIAGTSTRKIE